MRLSGSYAHSAQVDGITDASIAALSSLTQLQHLAVCNTAAEAEAASAPTPTTNGGHRSSSQGGATPSVSAAHTITSKSLSHLTALTTLRHLEWEVSPGLTAAQMSAALPVLGSLENLRYLHIWGPRTPGEKLGAAANGTSSTSGGHEVPAGGPPSRSASLSAPAAPGASVSPPASSGDGAEEGEVGATAAVSNWRAELAARLPMCHITRREPMVLFNIWDDTCCAHYS